MNQKINLTFLLPTHQHHELLTGNMNDEEALHNIVTPVRNNVSKKSNPRKRKVRILAKGFLLQDCDGDCNSDDNNNNNMKKSKSYPSQLDKIISGAKSMTSTGTPDIDLEVELSTHEEREDSNSHCLTNLEGRMIHIIRKFEHGPEMITIRARELFCIDNDDDCSVSTLGSISTSGNIQNHQSIEKQVSFTNLLCGILDSEEEVILLEEREPGNCRS